MKQKIKDNLETIIISLLLTLFLIFAIVFTYSFFEMLNDHRCYNLPPQDFFKDPKCEKYWTYRVNK